MNCQRALAVDEVYAQTLKDRYSIYGDVWQNEEEDDIEEVLLEAGNGGFFDVYVHCHFQAFT